MTPADLTPLIRVEQRNAYDCGVACLAMLTGATPNAIEERLGYRPADTHLPELPLGVLNEESVLFLHEYGLGPVWIRSREDVAEEGGAYREGSDHAWAAQTLPLRRIFPDHAAIWAMIQGRRAELSVRRRGLAHGHAVVWDRDRPIDPHPKRHVEHQGFGVWRIRSAIILMA